MISPAQQRRRRVRAKVQGTTQRPRLSVFVSNRQVSAQLIDDSQGVTLASVTSLGTTGTMTEKATKVGEQIAAAASKKKISAVVFDRGSRLYHGRLDALATAARNKGLEF